MSNDSKFALLLGILVVMFMGIVFFRGDVAAPVAPTGPTPAHIEAPKTQTQARR